MKPAFYIMAVFFAVLIVFFGTLPCIAQNALPEKPDGLMAGFEENAVADDDFDPLLHGFEDESTPNPENPAGQNDVLEGFDESPLVPVRVSKNGDSESSWNLEGDVSLTAIANVSSNAKSPWNGVSMVRPDVTLTLKNRLSRNWRAQASVRGFYDAVYTLRKRGDYARPVLDTYEKEVDLKDTFIQGRLSDHLDIKLGRQIVVWGTLDTMRVTDVLNPLDRRVPGLTDIENLRLPVTMARADAYFGNWNLVALLIPETRFSQLPVFGSDFYPASMPPPQTEDPENGFHDMQYAVALTAVFSGWDIGFYGADRFADKAHFEPVPAGLPGQFVRKHARTRMLGTAINLAAGNWLYKAEFAGNDGLHYTHAPGVDFGRFDIGGGVEYSGFSEMTVSLEAVNRHLADYDRKLGLSPDETRENDFQWSLRIVQDCLNDTLTLTLQAATLGIRAEDGAFERMDATYALTDSISIRGGLILYQSGDKGVFRNVAANDRVFTEIKYSF